MISKSFRPTKEDYIGITKIIEADSRIEKSFSEALYYAYKDAATNPPDWNAIKKLKFNDDIEIHSGSSIMTFTVDEEDFAIVLNSIKEQLGLERVRISYMTRLCILAARSRLGSDGNSKNIETRVEIKNIDAVDLLRAVNEEAAKLIMAGQYDKIMNFLREDK